MLEDKTIRVSFIGACDVLQHIVSVKESKYGNVEAVTQSLASDDVHCLEEDITDKGFLKSSNVEPVCRASVCPPLSSAAETQRTTVAHHHTFVPEHVQSYFDSHSSHTSDRTLSHLGSSRLQYSDMLTTLQDVRGLYETEQNALLHGYQQLFDKWMYEMCCHNFNLLLYGVGSKQCLINNFIASKLSDVPHVVVNGFFPSLTIKNILSAITENILEQVVCVSSIIEHFEFIRHYFESRGVGHVFLIVHNIDGIAMRSSKVQTILSMLACVRGLHIIASVDHINAHLLWDQTEVSRFSWICYDVTSYEHYADETTYENSLVYQGSTVQLSSLIHVMRSLTHNAREIFLLLVKHQLASQDSSTYIGLSYPDLYHKCRECFYVNSDIALRAQLTEFCDHKLVRIKKGIDGVEYLKIPMDMSTLAKFIEDEDIEDVK